MLEPPEEIRLGQVLKLFSPRAYEHTSDMSDPLMKIWLETASQFEETWERLTISELAQRTAGGWNLSSPAEPRPSRAEIET